MTRDMRTNRPCGRTAALVRLRPTGFTLSAALAAALGGMLAAVPALSVERVGEPPNEASLGAQAAEGAIADLAAGLDYDVDRIFRFVADEIRYEPYEGSLRGAVDTLRAGAGNSVDQALLLAALLDESLLTYQIAQGPIDSAVASRLLESAAVSEDEAQAALDETLVIDSLDAMERHSSSQASADAETQPLAADAEGLAGRGAAVFAAAEKQLADMVGIIESSLTAEAIDLPVEDISVVPEAEIERHTWVQFASGADWLDLDPSMAGSEIGAAVAEPAETFVELPAAQRYGVEFRVVVERVLGESLISASELEYSGYADALAGTEITFGHTTPSGMERLGLAISDVFGSAGLEYVPFLEVGGVSIVADEPLTFGADGSAGDSILGDSGLFESDAGATGSVGLSDGEATAEWLEVAVTPPGGEPVITRRSVFDRLSPRARFGGDPSARDVQAIELFDLDGSGPEDFLPLVAFETFAIATGPTPVAQVIDGAADPAARRYGVLALAYHALRDLLASEIALGQGLLPYVDGPNIISMSSGVEPVGDGLQLRTGLDVWHRDLGTLALAGAQGASSHPAVVTGVLAHVAERAALSSDDPAEPVDRARSLGVGEIFELARDSATPITTIQGPLSSEPPYGPRANAMIAHALAQGKVVVVPADPVLVDGVERIGWWQVDPTTGSTVDVMDSGAGAQEYPVTLTPSIRVLGCALAVTPFIYPVIAQEYKDPPGLQARKGVALGLVTLFFERMTGKGPAGACVLG